MSLCDKYAPTTINGILGNESVKSRLVSFAAEAQGKGRVRPIMLCGPSGVGKTAAAHALACSNGFELIELNASDYRDAATIAKKIMPLSSTRGLFSAKCLILFDEIDELSSKFDSGCEGAITRLIKESRHPIMFIVNDYWNRKVSFLRDAVEKVEFKRMGTNDTLALLERVAAREGIKTDKDILVEIAKRSNGDVRGALNDLEMMAGQGPELLEFLGMRSRKAEIFKVLDSIFLSSSFDVARNVMSSTDVDLDMIQNWVAQNIPNKYLSKMSIYEAFDSLAKASMFSENASRRSYYGYLRYSSVLTSSGVALSSNGNVSMLTQYTFPVRIRQLSRTKKGRQSMNLTALKLGAMVHASRKTVISEHIPLLTLMINMAIGQHGEDAVVDFMAMRYGLEEDEVDAIASYSKYGQ
jgi:replication factor C large subunit